MPTHTTITFPEKLKENHLEELCQKFCINSAHNACLYNPVHSFHVCTTHTAAADYLPRTNLRLGLTPGQSECVNFTTFNDSVIEAEEYFLVTLTALDPIDVAEDQVTVFIEDNDGKHVYSI